MGTLFIVENADNNNNGFTIENETIINENREESNNDEKNGDYEENTQCEVQFIATLTFIVAKSTIIVKLTTKYIILFKLQDERS